MTIQTPHNMLSSLSTVLLYTSISSPVYNCNILITQVQLRETYIFHLYLVWRILDSNANWTNLRHRFPGNASLHENTNCLKTCYMMVSTYTSEDEMNYLRENSLGVTKNIKKNKRTMTPNIYSVFLNLTTYHIPSFSSFP